MFIIFQTNAIVTFILNYSYNMFTRKKKTITESYIYVYPETNKWTRLNEYHTNHRNTNTYLVEMKYLDFVKNKLSVFIM